MWDYSSKVHDHFLNPHHAGPIPDANAIGEVGSLACGDALKLYLKINPQGVIEDAGFETFGCASAIASSSVLTDLIIGKTVDEALKITNKDIARELDGLPKQKMHCSVMGEEALEAAIRNWKGEPAIPHTHEEGKVICKCFGVTDEQIKHAIKENNLKTVEEITDFTKAGGGCGDCAEEIARILAEELHTTPPTGNKTTKPLTNVQRMQKIIKVIDEDIRPQLTADGGDIELVDVDGNLVTVSFHGRCSQCRASEVTIKNLVEKQLRDHVDKNIIVEEV